jgi:hypothetical protein
MLISVIGSYCFLNAVHDLRYYLGSAGSVASFAHNWFVEVLTDEDIIQMRCAIVVEKPERVLGELGEFVEGGGGLHFGRFQSQQLYQWYQTYHARWSTPSPSDQ